MIRTHVGKNGILHTDIPVTGNNAELELRSGSLQDEPLIRYLQGKLQQRNWDDLFTGH